MERTSIKSFFDRSYHRLFNGHRCYYSPKRKERYDEILVDLDDYVYRALGDGWFLKSKCAIQDMSDGNDEYYKKLKMITSVDVFQEFLKGKLACPKAKKWAQGKTIEQAIDQCHRGDWLLWLAEKLKVDKRLLAGTAGHCANTVRHLMKNEISERCVDFCILYSNGEATDKQLIEAWNRAEAVSNASYRVASYAEDKAWDASLDVTKARYCNEIKAACKSKAVAKAKVKAKAAAKTKAEIEAKAKAQAAAYCSAAAAAWTDYAMTTARIVAEAVYAAAEAEGLDAAEAKTKNQLETADICREHLKYAMLQKWNELHVQNNIITKNKQK